MNSKTDSPTDCPQSCTNSSKYYIVDFTVQRLLQKQSMVVFENTHTLYPTTMFKEKTCFCIVYIYHVVYVMFWERGVNKLS